MKTCERCGLINPDSSARCECGGYLIQGDLPAEQRRNGAVAGFWIRLLSDLLDAVFLAILGWVLTLFAGDQLQRLGERGVWLGMGVSMLYTTLLHSRIGGGQTLGKRLLDLRVVRMDGSLLSLDRALVRWWLMGFLVYGSAAGYALLSIAPFLRPEIVAAGMAGIQVALFLGCGLLVPFHPLKRGLHDLLTDTLVVRRALPREDLLARGSDPRRDRRLVIGAIVLGFMAAIGAVYAFANLPAQREEATRVAGNMEALGIQNPSVADTIIRDGSAARHVVVLSGYLPMAAVGDKPVAELHVALANLARKELSMTNVDVLRTALRTGINIGIYSRYETSTENHLPVPTAVAQ